MLGILLVGDGYSSDDALQLHAQLLTVLQILEGIATVILSFLAAYFLPESLETATFFTEEERAFAGEPPLTKRIIHTAHSTDQSIASDWTIA